MTSTQNQTIPPNELMQMLQFTVEKADDSVFWVVSDGRVVWANEAASLAIGYTREELLTHNICSFNPELTPEAWALRWTELKQKGSARSEAHYATRDGRSIPVEVAFSFLAVGEHEYVVVSVHNIELRRRVIEEGRETSQLLSVLFDSAPMAIVGIEPDGTVKTWNVAATRIFGWTADEVIGKQLPFVPRDRPAEFLQHREALMEGEAHTGIERHCITKTGDEIQVRMSLVPLRGADGEISGLVGLLEDITEQKRLEAQLLQAQRLENIGRLAGAVAHDFNNLLTVINGYGELALSQLDPRDPLHESVHEIKAAGDRAASLTQQLLAFSRRQVLQPKVLDIGAVVTELEGMLRRLIGEDIELVLGRDPYMGMVKADPVQVHQVIMNLAVNARDAMPSGGRLAIETCNVDLGNEITRIQPDIKPGPYVMLSVTDNGSGMDEATQSRLFEPFFTTKAPGKGTGLGLSTVYGIVKQSGGHITVDSEVGRGTSFRVYLPRVEAAEIPDSASSRQGVVAPGTETLLLVEDQQEVRQLALQVLEIYGYKVLAAANGDQALEIARANPDIDLMVTDVVMPGMTGPQLAQNLLEIRPNLKVIFMSGYADAAMAPSDVPEGAGYLQKPFAPETLARQVREVLDSRPAPGRILIVDDEAEIRKLLRQFLESAGYSVIEAADGRRAVSAVDAGGVSLVITDLVMPEKEGIETIREMRQRHPDVKIIAMSGAFGGRFLKTAEMLGAHSTLLKPVRAEGLVRAVRDVLGR